MTDSFKMTLIAVSAAIIALCNVIALFKGWGGA